MTKDEEIRMINEKLDFYVMEASDEEALNRASGLLFIIYGIIFVILGIPLLDGQNTPYVLLSVIGVMVETIVIMAAYSLVIVKKYEEK